MIGVERGMRIGGHGKGEAAARRALGHEGVLTAYLIVTIIDIPVAIVDHPVVVARIGTEARDDHFMGLTGGGCHRGRGIRVGTSGRSSIFVAILDRRGGDDVDRDGGVRRLAEELSPVKVIVVASAPVADIPIRDKR